MENSINNILDRVQDLLDNKLYIRANNFLKDAIKKAELCNADYLPQLYYEYAFILFEGSQYEPALNMFIKSYNLSFNCEEIQKILYDVYIKPNIDNIRSNYESYKNVIIYGEENPVSFDELTCHVLPWSDDFHYVFDWKEKSIVKINNTKLSLNNILPDVVALGATNAYVAITQTERGTIYIILKDISIKTAYFMASPNKGNEILFFTSVDEFRRYVHENTEISLPRRVLAEEKVKEMILNILDSEYNYRLKESV